MIIEDRRPHELPTWVNQTASGIWWEVPGVNTTARVDVTADQIRVRRWRWIGANEDVTFPMQGILRVYLDRDPLDEMAIACRIPALLGKDRHLLPVVPGPPYTFHPLVLLLRELVADADAERITDEEAEDRAALRELTRQRTRSG